MNGRIKKFSEKKYPAYIIIYPEKKFTNYLIESSVILLFNLLISFQKITGPKHFRIVTKIIN